MSSSYDLSGILNCSLAFHRRSVLGRTLFLLWLNCWTMSLSHVQMTHSLSLHTWLKLLNVDIAVRQISSYTFECQLTSLVDSVSQPGHWACQWNGRRPPSVRQSPPQTLSSCIDPVDPTWRVPDEPLTLSSEVSLSRVSTTPHITKTTHCHYYSRSDTRWWNRRNRSQMFSTNVYNLTYDHYYHYPLKSTPFFHPQPTAHDHVIPNLSHPEPQKHYAIWL